MDIRRDTGVSTLFVSQESVRGGLHTREAVAFRVTMMIGQTGRYFEIIRAELPLCKN